MAFTTRGRPLPCYKPILKKDRTRTGVETLIWRAGVSVVLTKLDPRYAKELLIGHGASIDLLDINKWALGFKSEVHKR